MIRVNLLGLPKKKSRAPVVTLQGQRSIALLALIVVAVGAVQFYRFGKLQQEETRVTRLIRDRPAEKVRLEGVRGDYERLLKQKDQLAKRTNIIEGLKAKQSGPSKLLAMLVATVTN